MPIVEPIPKPAWRVQRQRDIAKRLAAGGDCWPIEKVRSLFVDIVWDRLPSAIREDVREGAPIEIRFLSHIYREHLEDLYDALVERCKTQLLFLAWDEVEENVRREEQRRKLDPW